MILQNTCPYISLKKNQKSLEKLEQFLSETKTTGHTVREILTDGGKEFVNKETSRITNKYGINNRITILHSRTVPLKEKTGP